MNNPSRWMLLALLGPMFYAQPAKAESASAPQEDDLDTTFRALCDRRGTRFQMHFEPWPSWQSNPAPTFPRCTLVGDRHGTQYSCQCDENESPITGDFQALLDAVDPLASIDGKLIDKSCMDLRTTHCRGEARSIRASCQSDAAQPSSCHIEGQGSGEVGFVHEVAVNCSCANRQAWDSLVDVKPVEFSQAQADEICRQQLQACETRLYPGASPALLEVYSGPMMPRTYVRCQADRLDNPWLSDECNTETNGAGKVRTKCYCADDSSIEDVVDLQGEPATLKDLSDGCVNTLQQCQERSTPLLGGEGTKGQSLGASGGSAPASMDKSAGDSMSCRVGAATGLRSWMWMSLLLIAGGVHRRGSWKSWISS